MTRVAAPLLLLVALGPYLALEALGARAHVAALTGGDLAAVGLAVTYLAARTWAIFATVPVLVTLFVWLWPADRLPGRRSQR